MITIGNIRIDRTDSHTVRVTIDSTLPYVDELEAEGESLSEALASLQEKVETYE